MPKLLNHPPKLAKNGDYAYVNHANKRIPMGRWGSSESEHNYRTFCASWTPEDPLNLALSGKPITVEKLTELFLADIEPTQSKKMILYYRTISEVLTTLYANISVEKFGPKELYIVQKYIWDLPKQYATSHVNKLMELARKMFYWGSRRSLVPESVIDNLRKIKPVNIHRGTYKTTKKKILNIPDDETLERMSPYLPPTIIAMVKIQKITGMQVKEILRIQTASSSA